ncbi:structural protein [Lactococcus phage AM7]|uniref:Structural protein n=2 Tax=Teubervirus AM6 TaxID=2845190 RepID=A0A1W6JIH7_9CAUD|nr:virion structural protein [Lactococcus phage AM6]ARM66019.1 structural protein [Lactococcus phage AM6]ARM66109.1 structural protein [Lactococcus phage AM7]
MSINCRTDYELQSVAMPTQGTTKKLFFNYTDEVDSCVKIRPQDVSASKGVTNYRSKVKNTDFLNCPDALCIRKGIMEFAQSVPLSDSVDTASVSYKIPIDAKDYALGGVITFNLHAKEKATLGGEYKYNVTVILGDTANADVYTLTGVTTSEGHGQTLVAVALSDVPTKLVGSGWAKTGITTMTISVVESAKGAGTVGIGNIQVFDTIAEFAKNDVGWMTCLDTFEFNPSMDATDPDCVKVALDPSSADTEITINAKKWSSNLLDASPLMELVDDNSRAIPVMTKGVVDSKGMVSLPDFSTTECGFIGAQSEDCNADEGRLKYMSLDTVKTLSEDQFQIVHDKDKDLYFARFNQDYIGSTVTVIYPKDIEVEVYKISLNGGKVRPVRLMVPVDIEGGYDWYYSITGFFNNLPLGFSTTENSTAEFTFTPTPVNGYIGEVIKSKETN